MKEMITFNEKFTGEEIAIIKKDIALRALLCVDNAPTSQVEFDEYCERVLKNEREYVRKEEEKRRKREERNAQPGYRARQNYKRHTYKINSIFKEIEKLYEELAEEQKKKDYYANKYKEETGKEVE